MRNSLKFLLAVTFTAATLVHAGGTALADGPCDNADTPVSSLTQDDAEAAVLCLTNLERAANGLPALTPSNELTSAARWHAGDAVTLQWWVDGADPHTNPLTGSTPADRISAAGYCPNPNFSTVGENTFWGWSYGAGAAAPTARDAVTWWMGSPGHRANILNPDFTELGVGIVLGTAAPVDQDAVEAATFVQDFGTCA
jgi:uncharacterized protein YkwD